GAFSQPVTVAASGDVKVSVALSGK
ncbi:MAG: hypothetical protein JWM95_1886, partial [Gemmatimonadetes bacterium]|nr:hypothetical protein [Gemmatimonadota bacterium]